MLGFKCIWIKSLPTDYFFYLKVASSLPINFLSFPLDFLIRSDSLQHISFFLPQQFLTAIYCEKCHFSLLRDSACASELCPVLLFFHPLPSLHFTAIRCCVLPVLSEMEICHCSFQLQTGARGAQNAPLQAFPCPSLASWLKNTFIPPILPSPSVNFIASSPHAHGYSSSPASFRVHLFLLREMWPTSQLRQTLVKCFQRDSLGCPNGRVIWTRNKIIKRGGYPPGRAGMAYPGQKFYPMKALTFLFFFKSKTVRSQGSPSSPCGPPYTFLTVWTFSF